MNKTEKKIKSLKLFLTVFLVASAVVLLCAALLSADGIDDPSGTLVFKFEDDFYLYNFKDEPKKLTADGYDKITDAAGWMTDELHYCIAEKDGEFFALRFENGELAQKEAIPASPNTVKRFGNRLFIAYDDCVLYLSAVDGSLKTLTEKTGAEKILTSKNSFVLLSGNSYRLCKRDNGVLSVGKKKSITVDAEAFVFLPDEKTIGLYNEDTGEVFSLDAESGKVTEDGFNLDSLTPIAGFENVVLCRYEPKTVGKGSFWLFDAETSCVKAVQVNKMLREATDIEWER